MTITLVNAITTRVTHAVSEHDPGRHTYTNPLPRCPDCADLKPGDFVFFAGGDSCEHRVCEECGAVGQVYYIHLYVCSLALGASEITDTFKTRCIRCNHDRAIKLGWIPGVRDEDAAHDERRDQLLLEDRAIRTNIGHLLNEEK